MALNAALAAITERRAELVRQSGDLRIRLAVECAVVKKEFAPAEDALRLAGRYVSLVRRLTRLFR